MRSRTFLGSNTEANPVLTRTTMPWIFVSTVEMALYKSIAFLWKLVSFFSRNTILVLLLFFTWRLTRGFPMLASAYSWLRTNLRRPSFDSKILQKLLSLPERFLQRCTDWPKKTAEGIKREVIQWLTGNVPQRTPGSSVRQLLCNDVGCKVCERASQEASQLMSSGRTGGYGFPGFRALLSHGPLMGRPPQLDAPDSFPRSASAPAPIYGEAPLTPMKPASCDRPLRSPSFLRDDREETFSLRNDREETFSLRNDREETFSINWEHVSEGSRGSSRRSGDRDWKEEEVLSFSSTTHEMSQISWTTSSSNLSELSFSSSEEGKSCRCHRVPRKPRKRGRDSSWVCREASAGSQTSDRETESFYLRMRMHSQSSLSETSHGRRRKRMGLQAGRRKAPSRATDSSASRAQAVRFTAVDISFLDKAVVASLESHLLGKRVQHLLGLPPALLRSIRGFVPSAPRSAPQRALVGVTVVTTPPALSFVAERAKKSLEVHLKKMVRMKRWQLPQRVQEALKHMRPPSQPREAAAFPPKKRTPSPSKKPAEESCSELSCVQKQQVLQRNLAKRAVEMQLGVAAPALQQLREASPQAPKPALPKVILPGLRPPEPRSQQQIHSLDLQVLGHIQLNIAHKDLACCLGLPSLYRKSLAQLFPDAAFPTPAFPLPRRSAAFSFTSTRILFLHPEAQEELEWHVRRKILQHAWGLPGLIQRSLQVLLPTCRQVRPWSAGAHKVSISALELSFVSEATQRELERNVQKRVVHQRWLLPQRVLDSVRLLYPQGQLDHMTSHEPCAVGQEETSQETQKVLSATPPLLLPAQLARTRVVLRLHLVKKSLEIHFEIFPAAVRVSWRCRFLVLRAPLPKFIRPGHKPLLPRRPLPHSASTEQMSQIELALQRSHLASLWGLGTRYVEALRGMRYPGPPRRRRVAFVFSGARMTILPRKEAEALELHIKRKRLQHEWGFPVLVHRSLRRFVCEPPPQLPVRQTGVSVHVLVQDVLFLPQNLCSRLELHVQKMKLQRLWGLPRRVLESLRTLWPELKASAHRQKPSVQLVGKSSTRKAGHGGLPVTPVVGKLCTVCYKRRVATLSQGFPTLGHQNLEKIRVHAAKKRVEMHWEVFPAVAVRSWRQAALASREPLPKWVLRGEKPLQPRKPILSFGLAEDVKKIEVSVRCGHLSSLWGLGQRYVEALSAMTPAPHAQPLRRRKASPGFSAVQTLFFQKDDRESLERHVRRKKLQHEWGFPVFVQSSLRAFMQGPLPERVLRPETSGRIEICIHPLHGELLLLPRTTCLRLEHHIQRLKLQRQWELPKRILESLQLLFPAKTMLPAGSSAWTAGAMGVEPDRKKARRMKGAVTHPSQLCFPLEGMTVEKLQLHMAKKSFEVHLEAFPAVSRLSRQRASLSLRQTLPRPLHPGSVPLKPRSSCLSFSVEQLGQIEVALQRSYLVSLWELGTRYIGAVAGMTARLPFRTPVRPRGVSREFLAVETLFFQRSAREELELHVQKKRIQHLWESPALVQRSLLVFMRGPPRLPSCPKTVIQICVLHQELLFLPRRMCNLLEFHVQRMKLQRRWGLPRRVLESLEMFLPTALPGRALLPQSVTEKKFTKAEFSPTGSRTDDARQRETCHVPHVKREHVAISTRAILETHLKKKALESKFQLMTRYKALVRPVRSARLPKPPSLSSGLRPRRPVLLFLEQEVLVKIQLNIHQKYLTSLWGLPSLQTKSLAKMYGRVPGRPLAGKVATKVLGREKSRGPVATGLEPSKRGASFLTKEALVLLEMHILRKKLQRQWGLPSTIQKSLRAFSLPPSKLQRSSSCAAEVSFITTQCLVFLDPVRAGGLEAHVKKRTAAHKWGLPKLVQESLKMFLPPASVSQGGQAETLLCTCSGVLQPPLDTCGQGLQAAEANSPLEGQLLPRAEGQPSELKSIAGERKHLVWVSKGSSSHTHGQGPQAAGVKAQSPLEEKVEGEGQALPRAKGQPLELKSIAGERKHLVRVSKGSSSHTHGQGPQAAGVEAQSPLEEKVEGEGQTHPRAEGQPSELKSIAGERKHLVWVSKGSSSHTHGQGPQAAGVEAQSPLEEKVEGEGQALPRAEGQPLELPPAGVHQETSRHGSPAPKTQFSLEPAVAACLTNETRERLEFHVKRKRIQHDWGLPSTVQKSLRAFAPPPPEPQRHAKARVVVRINPEKSGGQGKGGVAAHPPQSVIEGMIPRRLLRFMSADIKDCLETHVKRWATDHRWGLPRRIGHSARAILPAQQKTTAGESKHPLRLWKHHHDSPQRREIHSHSEGEESSRFLRSGKRKYPVAVSKHHHNSSSRHEIHSHSEGEESSRFLRSGKRKYPVAVSKHHHNSSSRHEIHSHSEGEESSRFLRSGKRKYPVAVSKHHHNSPSRREIHSHSEGEESLALQPSRKAFPQKPKGQQRKKWLAKSMGMAAVISPMMKPHFLPEEALELLEFHIIHKRIQHAWTTPSVLQEFLGVLAPFPLDLEENVPKTHPWKGVEVKATTQDLSFLKSDTKERLEAHVRTLATRHRWEIPKRVQQSLRAFLPHRPASQPEVGQAPFPCQFKSLLAATDGYQKRDDNKDSLQGAQGRRSTGKKQKVLSQGQRGTVSVFSFPGVRLPFLPHEAQNVLEHHIQRKNLQHAWGLPSTVLKSLHAFASPPLEPQTQQQGKMGAHHLPWDEGDMQIVIWRLSFLSPETKERLNGHLRRMVEKRRWGLPELVQRSLRAFVPPRSASQSERGQSRHPSPPTSKSPHYAADSEVEGDTRLASGMEGDSEDDSLQEVKPSRGIMKKPKGKLHHWKVEVTFFCPEVTCLFLPHEAQNVLERHIQRKKLQRAWGLPSTVLRSLHAFAPLPLEPQKQPPGKTVARRIPWDAGDVQIVIRTALFLSPETKEHLNGHLRRMVEKRKWGLPELVQRSLRAFMPPRPASRSELDQLWHPSPPPSKSPHYAADSEAEGDIRLASGTEEDSEDDSSREAKPSRDIMKKPEGKLPHQKQATASIRVNVSACFCPEVTCPFLSHEAQNVLERHIQRKKLQHSWGLPSAVLKSLHAFAPLSPEPQKRPPRRTAARQFPWDEGNVEITTRRLSFINPEVKERLESHLRSLTAGHRWDLQKHAQEVMRAFLLPRPPSAGEMGLKTQPHDYQEASVIRPPFQPGSSVQKVPGELEEEEELLAAAPSATSSTSLSCERALPFLARHLRDFLEFHIRHKKLQRTWGLPATIQRSLNAFAPVPPGAQEGPLSAAGASIPAARAAKTRASSKNRRAQVTAQQLPFLHTGTKEHLERHVRGLTVEHRWHVPKRVQESARAFRLQADGPQEEQPSKYYGDRTLDSSDTTFKTETEQESSSELFPQQGQDNGEASWVETEEESLCLCGRTRQGSLLKKPSRSPRIPDGMQESGVPSHPHPAQRPKKYVHNAGRWPERHRVPQRVRYTCGRITHVAPRSSSSSLGKRRKKKKIPWQLDGGFEGVAEDSHLTAGADWEPREDCKLPNCSCPYHFSRKTTITTSSSSSQLAAKQRWRQQEQEEGAEDGKEAGGISSSLLSEDIELQIPGPSSGDSIRDTALLEEEAAEADLRPLGGTESSQQCSLCPSHQALVGVFLGPTYAVESQSSYEDIVARHYKPASRSSQAKPRSGLRTGGWKVGWGKEKRVEYPIQTMADAAWPTDTGRQASSSSRELRGWSSESLCQECLSLKSPSLLEGSEEDPNGPPFHQGAQDFGASSDSPKDSERQAFPVSSNEGFLGAEGEFQNLGPDLPLPTDDDGEAMGGREEPGTSSSTEEQLSVLMESMSEFSTECEWEQVGDWDSKEEGDGRSDWLAKEEEEGGEGSSSSNWPGSGREATGSLRHENSPTDGHSLASLEKARPSQTALLWEAGFVLSNMKLHAAATDSASAPQWATAEEEAPMPPGRPPARAGSQESVDEKVSLLSKILERKLSLDHGLRVFRRSDERLRELRSKRETSGQGF